MQVQSDCHKIKQLSSTEIFQNMDNCMQFDVLHQLSNILNSIFMVTVFMREMLSSGEIFQVTLRWQLSYFCTFYIFSNDLTVQARPVLEGEQRPGSQWLYFLLGQIQLVLKLVGSTW